MTIFRVEHNKDYTVVNNHICTDKRLSWKAKGIWLYAFSRPNDWTFVLQDLINQSTDGKDGVSTGLKELVECGYLQRTRIREPNGTLKNSDWTFFEKPLLKESLPKPENPILENPILENPPLLSTEVLASTDKRTNKQDDEAKQKNVVVVFSDEREKRETLEKYHLTESTLQTLISFDLKKIKNGVLAFDQYSKTKKVDNVPGCLVSMISKGNTPNYTKKQQLEDEEKAKEKKIEHREKNRDLLLEMYNKHCGDLKKGYSFYVSSKQDIFTYTLTMPKQNTIVEIANPDAISILKQFIITNIKEKS